MLSEIAAFAVFCKVFFFRLLTYVTSVFVGMGYVYATLNMHFVRFKKYMIRLLMFKGGYFHHTPRLGLAAVMSTTFFSVIALPISNPFAAESNLSDILADTEVSAATADSVLTNNTRSAKIELNKDLREEVVQHTVKPGETIGTIAEDYLVSVEALEYVNDLNNESLIHPGDELTIPPVDGLIHHVDAGETVSSIATTYNVPPQAIVDFNHLNEPYVLHEGNELVIPDANVPAPKPVEAPVVLAANTAPVEQSVPAPGLALEPIAAPAAGTGGFIMPTGGVITQYFSNYHPAIDVASSCGTPIVAADSGTIYFAGWWAGGGGNSVMIDHGNGYVTKYAHLSGFERTGGTVNKGDVIGYQGATGRAYGCHLHFIVQNGGRFVNPMTVL